MKEMDCVEVIVEKEKYTKHGVHIGMQGWICWHECIDGAWLVDFPQPMDKPQIATIGIHEDDMKAKTAPSLVPFSLSKQGNVAKFHFCCTFDTVRLKNNDLV